MNNLEDDKLLLASLDMEDARITPFIPAILENLQELGSMPMYMVELIEKHIPQNEMEHVLDLGCGKGAVLIEMSKRFNFTGFGIDLIPEFIESAKKRSATIACANHLHFLVDDMVKTISRVNKFDLLIYAHDSNIFGDVLQTLNKLHHTMRKGGWLLIETVHLRNNGVISGSTPSKKMLANQFNKSGLSVVDQINWELDKLKEVNKINNQMISSKIEELIASNPKEEKIFASYLANQIEECKWLENEVQCTTTLLKKTK